MKNSLIGMLVLVAVLVGIEPRAVREARSAAPVIQVVEVTGHRKRFDTLDPASVRYLLIDPSNAVPAVDGFAPISPLGVLMLFTGGDGRLNLALRVKVSL